MQVFCDAKDLVADIMQTVCIDFGYAQTRQPNACWRPAATRRGSPSISASCLPRSLSGTTCRAGTCSCWRSSPAFPHVRVLYLLLERGDTQRKIALHELLELAIHGHVDRNCGAPKRWHPALLAVKVAGCEQHCVLWGEVMADGILGDGALTAGIGDHRSGAARWMRRPSAATAS